MELKGEQISLVQLAAVAVGGEAVRLSPVARPRILASRKLIEQIVARDAVVYGVTTGFGKLSDVRIPQSELRQLQLNLVRSHACGIGNPLSEAEVRAMMVLRANVLALGFSGIRCEVIELLCEMLNRRVCPVVPEKGSVGASGDLAPLAHLALGLIGEGDALFEGERMTSAEALRRAHLKPLQLEAKEGLALLNGTQAMHAVGGLALLRAKLLARVADVAGAMSLEALKGTPAAFDLRLQDARPHPGQKAVAEHLLSLMEGSEIRQSHIEGDPRVQDAYSLRCMPQVHGAVRGALAHCEDVLLIESASATDNPLVFAESGEVISGGNFHGAPLALGLDYAAIAIADLMSMSERRTDRLVNPDPASVDNITTSGGKEDHVSMGMTSALKLRAIVDLAENLLAIELLAAAEGLEHRRPLKAGVGVERAFAAVRKIAPPLTQDRALSGDIARVAEAIRRGDFEAEGEKS